MTKLNSLYVEYCTGCGLCKAVKGVDFIEDEKGYPLKMILRVGTMLLLYKDTPEELYQADNRSLAKRLYKVIGFGKDGRIKIRYQQEAREAKDLGSFLALDYNSLGTQTAQARVGFARINALVQGKDFELTETGKVVFK